MLTSSMWPTGCLLCGPVLGHSHKIAICKGQPVNEIATMMNVARYKTLIRKILMYRHSFTTKVTTSLKKVIYNQSSHF